MIKKAVAPQLVVVVEEGDGQGLIYNVSLPKAVADLNRMIQLAVE